MYAKAVVDQNPLAEDTYLLPFPTAPGAGSRITIGAGEPMAWFIPKGAKNREAAEQMIRYLVSPAVMKELFKISPGYVYPAYEWGWDTPEIKDNKYAQRVTDTWKAIASHPSGFNQGSWPGPPTPQVASLESSNFWTDMFGEIMGGKSVEDTVRDAHNRAVRVFKEFGAQGE
jgi:ABC-type glycerol-3-phosphate transport system substrate-binding protein